jgi:hypothetical protein
MLLLPLHYLLMIKNFGSASAPSSPGLDLQPAMAMELLSNKGVVDIQGFTVVTRTRLRVSETEHRVSVSGADGLTVVGQ